MQTEMYPDNTDTYTLCEHHEAQISCSKNVEGFRRKDYYGQVHCIPRCRCPSIRASLRESSRDPEARRLSRRLKAEAVLELQHRLQALRYGAGGG